MPPSRQPECHSTALHSRSKQTEIRYLTSGYHNTLPSVVTVAVPTLGLRAAVMQYAHGPGSTTAIILFEVALVAALSTV